MRSRVKDEIRKFLVALSFGLLALAPSALAVSPIKLSGGISGLVTDASGLPQMGATVLLFNNQERLLEKALTDEKGNFAFASLAPDFYTIRVTLASFLPAIKNNILVVPGVNSLLNVNLAGFFSSIQLVLPPAGQRAIMNDDWKWVLRTSSSTRPVLRLLPHYEEREASISKRGVSIFSDTRGLVRLSGGEGGSVSSLGNEADLGTAFAFATSMFGGNQVQVSGNVGYAAQSGLASAGFRGSYSRNIGGASPEISVTMRQLYLPGRASEPLLGGPGATGSLPALRTMSASFEDQTSLSDALSLQYGFSLDSVSFLDRLNYFSPYARLTYTLPDSSQLDFTWTSGNGRPDLARTAGPDSELQRDLNSLSIVPRVSLRAGRAKVQRGEDLELGYARTIGSREFRVSGFREHVTNAALTMIGADGLYAGGDILPDLFSSSYIFNAGDYQTLGYNASVTQNLGERFNVTMMYGSVGVLAPQSKEIASEDPDDLRAMIRASRRHAVTSRVSGVMPGSGTQFIASYQWADQRAVTPGHLYSTQSTRPEPGLNVYVRQPIPAFWSLPWRMEASADLRNMLAQGYLPLSFADGRRLLVMQTPRSFRGGLSFIF